MCISMFFRLILKKMYLWNIVYQNTMCQERCALDIWRENNWQVSMADFYPFSSQN